MALVKCPDCGREVSDVAPTCPGCGRPLRMQAAPKEVQARSGVMDGVKIGCGIFIVLPIIIILVLVAIGSVGSISP